MGKPMKYNPNPKSGDLVRVRLPNGKAVNAKYSTKHPARCKAHIVFVGGDRFCSAYESPKYNPFYIEDKVRFVYPIESMDKPELRE